MSIYITLGDKQEAGSSDLAYALNEVIDELIEVSLSADIEQQVIEILNTHGISHEV